MPRGENWTRVEVELIVEDYFSMLASELAGTPYNKASHRRHLLVQLEGRTEQAIEFKHANISAVLVDLNFPYINGYKPRGNYQDLLAEVVAERLSARRELLDLAAADVDRPIVVPEVDDILAALVKPPQPRPQADRVSESGCELPRLTTNYLEREARNRSLGAAGETFVLRYEQARLIHAGHESLAARIEHTARVRGDHAGFDILSFEENGAERLIEVKTTRYGSDTPFFVTRNELATSERNSSLYHVYRLFDFRDAPRLYTLQGAIGRTCHLLATEYRAQPR